MNQLSALSVGVVRSPWPEPVEDRHPRALRLRRPLDREPALSKASLARARRRRPPCRRSFDAIAAPSVPRIVTPSAAIKGLRALPPCSGLSVGGLCRVNPRMGGATRVIAIVTRIGIPPDRGRFRRSGCVVTKRACLPSTQIEIVSVSPGMTGFEKRPSIALKRFGIRAAERVQQRAAGEAVGAEAMEDRAIEAAHLRESGIGVERIAIARQAIGQRLILARRVRDFVVGLAGRKREGRRRAALAPEITGAAAEHRHLDLEERLARRDERRRSTRSPRPRPCPCPRCP